MGDLFASIAGSGPMLLAIGVAAIAGLVSILSPCMLPLVPGYLSYVTGLAGSDLDATGGGAGRAAAPGGEGAGSASATGGEAANGGEAATGGEAGSASAAGGTAVAVRAGRTGVKRRVLAGTALFVLGFSIVFTLIATLVANIGFTLKSHQDVLDVVLGVLVILLGLGYLGWIPGLQREARISRLPAVGLVGAPVFGALFALSWLPCTGPTLMAVLALATTSGQTSRAVTLSFAYSLGLGIPFMLFGLFFSKLLGVFRAIRRNSRWVTRIGGALLILIGIALVTDGWNHFLAWLLTTFDPGSGTLL